MMQQQGHPPGRANLGILLLFVAAMAVGCQSSTSIEGDVGLAGGDAVDASTSDGTMLVTGDGARETSATVSEIADDAARDKECTTEADCPTLPTNPANCAVAICNPQGVCTYAAKDADGDGHRSVGCRSTQRGFTV